MATRKTPAKKAKTAANYRHAGTRRNAPTAEVEAALGDDDKRPRLFAADRRKVNTPVLTWDRGGDTSVMAEDDEPYQFASQPLYVHEKIDPLALVGQISRRSEEAAADQPELFADFNGLPPDADRFKVYNYDGHWQNRLIHGESGMVMQSLIDRDGLAGGVQMIYYDPPYGMGYRSNFQPAVDDLNVADDNRAVPAGDALPLKAFRDTYDKGIDSYLDQIHKTAALGRELLADTGSFFLQIGDDNVHRCAVLLDEVFGSENRVATITWIPAGMSSSRLLSETASYLLWYAKDKSQAIYHPIYQERSRQDTIDDFGMACVVELPNGTTRPPTKLERQDVNNLPSKARLAQTMNLFSQGYSHTGRSVDYRYEGRVYATGATRQWCVSVHEPRHTNGTRLAPEGDDCPGDPDGRQDICGLCALKKQGRLHVFSKGNSLRWKWYENERPGTRYHNVWHQKTRPSNKRYVVQTSGTIIERCLLMTTDPGDLVLDPTCGSGATAEVAEEWGRRWVTCDVQRVSVAVARKHLMTRAYPWHRTVDGSESPGAGFEVETMPKVSAATLAYNQLDDPKNQIALVDRTKVDKSRIRVCSPFTVESSSPYRYAPVAAAEPEPAGPGPVPPDGPGAAPSAADDHDRQAVLDALVRTPVCDADSREMFRVASVTELPPGDKHSWLVTHVADCRERGRDTGFKAAVMVAAPDAQVNLDVAQRAVIEMKRQGVDARDLLLVGYDFANNLPSAHAGVGVHRVAADKGLQIAETIKGGENEGGTFTILSDLATDLQVVRDENRQPRTVPVRGEDGAVAERPLVTVELVGWDTYNPGTGAVRSGEDPDHLDAWMIDTNHDGLSFESRLVYFPSGLANDAGFKALAKSLGRGRDPEAENALWSLTSQPFPAPEPGKVIAVKAITKTGAEIAGLITEGWA